MNIQKEIKKTQIDLSKAINYAMHKAVTNGGDSRVKNK